MGLVTLARYADLQEARIAASRLDAAGIMALVPEETLGSNYFLLGQAMGGYRLCVIEEDVTPARELLAGCRTEDPAALEWTSHPEAVSAAPTAAFWALTDPAMGGFGWAGLRRRVRLVHVVGVALSLVATAVVVWAVVAAG